MEKKFLTKMRKETPLIKDAKVDISIKSEWAVIELMMDASSSKEDFTEVSPEFLKMRYDEILKLSKRIMDKVQPFTDQGCKPYRYTIMINGSRDNAWLKTYSDMTFLYKDKRSEQSEILQTNISYLNRVISGRGEVNVNSLKHGKVEGSLYVLGRTDLGGESIFPRDMVLEINIADVKTTTSYGDPPMSVSGSSPYDTSSIPEKKIYQTRQNYLINLVAFKSKLIELFMQQSLFLDIKNNDIVNVSDKGHKLKEDIYQLQNDINKHMKYYIPKKSDKKRKKKEKAFLARKTFEEEKQLLTTASVRFSLVSEVEHKIMRQAGFLQEIEMSIIDVVENLSIEDEEMALEGMSYSLGDISLREIHSKQRELKILMDELSHSRNILSATIEVLRTFIDTRQREVSEDMSRLMNLLFLVFACIGLADALGNFVIMVIQYGYLQNDPSVSEVFQYGSMGMIMTLSPLLIAAIFLYLFFKKK